MDIAKEKDFDNLSTTRPDMLRKAFSADEAEAMTARESFFNKYRGAVLRYAVSLTEGNVDLAEEIAQDFAHAYLEGRFIRAGESGRFRHYLKVSLKNLFHDHMEKLQRDRKRHVSLDGMLAAEHEISTGLLGSELVVPAIPADEELDRRIRESMSPVILNQTWIALDSWSAAQKPDGTYPGLTLYRFLKAVSACEAAAREEGRSLKGEELCAAVNQTLALSPPLTYANYRQRKSRGSLEFARLLLNEIRSTFDAVAPDISSLEEECIALGFQRYVERAWPKWKAEYRKGTSRRKNAPPESANL